MDILPGGHEAELRGYQEFLATNLASVRAHAMCEPSSGGVNHKNLNSSGGCNLVYTDGPPYYPATGVLQHHAIQPSTKDPSGPVFDSLWLGPYRAARPIQQTAVLDLALAGVLGEVLVLVLVIMVFVMV